MLLCKIENYISCLLRKVSGRSIYVQNVKTNGFKLKKIIGWKALEPSSIKLWGELKGWGVAHAKLLPPKIRRGERGRMEEEKEKWKKRRGRRRVREEGRVRENEEAW